MDKISGIIKSSPRVSTVDMKESGPIRPGTPAFGRPEGAASVGREINELEAGSRGIEAQKDILDWRAKDQKHAALAAELTNKFFAKAEAEEPAGPAPSERMPAMNAMVLARRDSQPAGFKTDDFGSLRAASVPQRPTIGLREFDADEAPMLAQPEGLFPKGSFLDRTA